MSVFITGVVAGSVSDRAGVSAGHQLRSVNGHSVRDVLDYQFYTLEPKLLLDLKDEQGNCYRKEIHKEEYEDLGLEFETYLMDKQTGCKNKCCFCFIDQLPQGMRDTLYFKDDDERLSFLFGNYITLTNLKEEHVERIIDMRISPVNVSVHTMNPNLRVEMMKNPRAGEVLCYLYRLADAGIFLNCQLVLCPGINDGKELESSLEQLTKLMPQVQSIACVPVGLTQYREGLSPLRPYTKEEAAEVIAIIDRFGERLEQKYGERMIYPSDEFFLTAELPIPDVSYYGPLSQLENGVGMSALLKEEFFQALEEEPDGVAGPCSIATSEAAYPLMCLLVDEAEKKWHNLDCKVYVIKNDFFGPDITVAGLVTGGDLIAQLQGKALGDRLLIPANMLRAERDIFLDDISLEEVEAQLGVPVVPVENDGYELLNRLLSR